MVMKNDGGGEEVAAEDGKKEKVKDLLLPI